MERLKYVDVVNFSLQYLQVPDGAYRSSFVKYSMKRSKDRQMKDARNLILKDIELKMLDMMEFNIEMIDRGTCKKMLSFYEARKLDVLAILSNPFKHQFGDKEKFVLELAVEQAKIEDQIFIKYGHEFNLFIKACNFYGLVKNTLKDEKELARDA
jgi:hypothetical protein